MMRIRWSRAAAYQLTAACEYIAADQTVAAEHLRKQVLDQVGNLAAYPEAGRAGRVAGTRELVIVHTPYIIAYRIKDGAEIQVLAILHSKRRWPNNL